MCFSERTCKNIYLYAAIYAVTLWVMSVCLSITVAEDKEVHLTNGTLEHISGVPLASFVCCLMAGTRMLHT